MNPPLRPFSYPPWSDSPPPTSQQRPLLASPPLRGGRIAPAEQPSCTRCVQPPPRAARGGGYPPRLFPPPPPPTANCWQWWGVGRGGWGLRCRVEKRDAASPPLIALLKDFSLNF
nr:hypothetical protein [Morchella crassipes]